MDRLTLVFLAKLAEQAERYTDMVDHMKTVAKDNTQELSMEENNLLLVAYKNEVGPRRAAWRVLRSIENKSTDKTHLATIQSYRAKVEEEIHAICADVMDLADDALLPFAHSTESLTFHHKMKGDYYRYWAEIQPDSTATNVKAKLAQASYKAAWALATVDLPPTHPLRLALALNYAVFYYEILEDPASACRLAKRAFDDAIAELDALSDDSYRDTTLIMQLLRDNVTLWTALDEEEKTI
ncbi:hypothetical protein LEN26_010083 [Aphanomyces euteiches]|nr:hypothetical protein LEN26_010083 [Aphanomyces euteiches]